jgi:hypothetical protein
LSKEEARKKYKKFIVNVKQRKSYNGSRKRGQVTTALHADWRGVGKKAVSDV